ncbi:MAG: quinol:cytochrome C oxidoreductase [Flavobacteriales bacterium]
MAHDKLHFELPAKTKTWSFMLMGFGALASIVGWFTDQSHGHNYWWAVLLICSFFFFAVALGALFFYAVQYAAEVAWSSQLKRIFEAMFSYVPIGFATIALILLIGQFHGHGLYHWMHDGVMDPANTNQYDAIIAGKQPYLSPWFFWLRIFIYGGIFLGFAHYFRKWSVQEDSAYSVEHHLMQHRRGALFLVFFAVFSSTIAWDVLMTIDVHWFSTMYGWYVFSGMWVTCMIFATMLLLWLKGKGYMSKVNDSHIHDMGKWIFAVSMLWSYLYFCQYMLIWYSNIPEEVTYFQERYENYMGMMWFVFFANFALPFYTLIARDAKRNPKFLIRVGSILFITHFLDLWMAVVPGTSHGHEMGHHAGTGEHIMHWVFTFGMFLGFLGLFIFIVTKALTKARLIPINHPYLNESENHHI